MRERIAKRGELLLLALVRALLPAGRRHRVLWREAYEHFLAGGGEHRTQAHP